MTDHDVWPTPRGSSLEKRQKAFAAAYAADPARNATKAAIAAGYSKVSAKNQGYMLLRNPRVLGLIYELTVEAEREMELSAYRTMQGIGQVAHANIMDFIDIDRTTGHVAVNLAKVDRATAGAIAEITTETFTEGRGEDARTGQRVRIKLADRMKGLDTLAKHFKLVGQVEDQAPMNVTFIIEGAPYAAPVLNVTPKKKGE